MRSVARLFVGLVVVAAAVAAGAGVVLQRLETPFKGFAEAEQFVEIPPRTSVAEMGWRLADAGVVADRWLFRVAVWRSGRGQSLRAGEYRFTDAARVADVVDRLVRGDVFTRRITFPEGLNIAEMARLYEEKGFGRAGDFVHAAHDATLIADLDSQASDLEGYLFPETYALARRADASSLVHAMVVRFRAACTDTLRNQAKVAGLTLREAVTLGAIVEKEAGARDERPLVAAVYRNRLRIGMPMQADPTVIYALQRAGRYDGNIHKADLDFDSPYNTYRYPGLPPGPIAAPGSASLAAAVAPANVPYLYFVSRNDGTHAFARTLAEHNGNVQHFQVEYFRQRRTSASTAAALGAARRRHSR